MKFYNQAERESRIKYILIGCALVVCLILLWFNSQPSVPEKVFKDGHQHWNHVRSKRSTSQQCKAEEEACLEDQKYRTLSGRCNNLKHPDLGMKSRPLRRLLPATYDDGKATLKARGKLGRLLNPRVISEVIHSPGDGSKDLSAHHTLTLMQWGQFLAHDLTKTPMVTNDDGLKLPCDKCKTSTNSSSSCEPIPIPKHDGYFPYKDKDGVRRCIPFTRSAEFKGTSSDEPREQLNTLTSYLDASSVYGSDLCHSRELRTFEHGHLKMDRNPWSPDILKPLMPKTSNNQECKSPSGECFFGGDDRSSEQPGLAAMHLIFVREHNRLADQLRFLNPDWSDESLFLEARKIVGAMHQHITYQEFLPRVLGPKMMEVSGLNRPYKYDPTCSPEIYNEFATAAFRFGHTLVRSHFNLKTRDGRKILQSAFLKDNFFNIDGISRPQYMDQLTSGILSEPMAKFDVHLSEQLTNHLFETKGQPFSGMDLAALNIQRGRDHGLQGYLQYLRLCTKTYFPERHQAATDIHNFGDLSAFVGLEAAARLSRVYRTVEDIDLFTGGLSEPHLEGGVVGMTFGCILSLQFFNLKNCDRFWFESREEAVMFRKEQLREIKGKGRLAPIMCRNMDVPSEAQPAAFDLMDSEGNGQKPCNLHPDLDMRFWRSSSSRARGDASYCQVDGIVIPAGGERRIGACRICSCPSQSCRLPERSCADLISDVGIYAVRADDTCKKLCPKLFD